VVTFIVLSISEGSGRSLPTWITGIALGIGGIIGGYTGARMQSRLPAALIRRIVGILALAIAVRFLWSGLPRARLPARATPPPIAVSQLRYRPAAQVGRVARGNRANK
jgi:predicted MFS family arabinose efflux permease